MQGIEVVSFLLRGFPRARHEVLINFSSNFNRKPCKEFDSKIEEFWKLKIADNKKIYNGSKFRYAGAHNKSDRIELDIGITDYKSLIGTNCSPVGKELQRLGLLNYNNKQAHLADPLGVGSLLLTSDDKFLFMKRALWTGEDAGKIDRSGGHPEPVEAAKKSQLTNRENFFELTNEDVANEIFDSVLCEIRDEMNIPIVKLSDPLLLGAVRSNERHGRPSLEFLVKCQLDADEIESLYRQGTQPEADESVGILFIPLENLKSKEIDGDVWSNLTDSSRGSIQLYSECNI